MGIIWSVVSGLFTRGSLTKYLPYVGAAIVVAFLYIQNSSLKYDILETTSELELVELKESLVRANLDKIKKDTENQKKRINSLQQSKNIIQNTTNQLKSELDGYRIRENVVIKKPTLIERRINNSVSNLLLDFESETSSN